jgi:bifunctional DNase/RNase
MTHDLFKNFAESLQVSIERVEVSDLRDTFLRGYFMSEAELRHGRAAGDAIALALRFARDLCG